MELLQTIAVLATIIGAAAGVAVYIDRRLTRIEFLIGRCPHVTQDEVPFFHGPLH